MAFENSLFKQPPSQKMKILIVDDSALLRERVTSIISVLPDIDIIEQAKSESEATSSIHKLKPDIVILDIRLSEGSGIEILKNIKKKESSPLVIMFTHYPYPQYRKKCKDEGADFVFDKSTEFHKIPKVLKKLIQESRCPAKLKKQEG